MAVAFVRAHTVSQTKTAGTTNVAVVTGASGVDSGNVLLAGVIFDNLSQTTPTVSSINKPGGETASWSRLGSFDGLATAAGALRGELWAIKTTTSWPATTSYTITLSGSVASKAAVAQEFSGVDLTVRSSGSQNATTNGARTASAATVSAGDLVAGVIAHETGSAPTADADTTNGTWGAGTTFGTAGGTSNTNVHGRIQWKIATASGAQSLDFTASNEGGVIIVALQPAPEPPANLIVAAASHALTSDSPTFPGSAIDLAPANASHGLTSSSPALTQVHVLAVDPSAHAQTAGAPALTQVHQLAIQSAAHDQAATAAALGIPPPDMWGTLPLPLNGRIAPPTLGASESELAVTSDTPSLTQTHQLTIASSSHEQESQHGTLSSSLTIASSTHAVRSGSATLVSGPNVAPADVLTNGSRWVTPGTNDIFNPWPQSAPAPEAGGIRFSPNTAPNNPTQDLYWYYTQTFNGPSRAFSLTVTVNAPLGAQRWRVEVAGVPSPWITPNGSDITVTLTTTIFDPTATVYFYFIVESDGNWSDVGTYLVKSWYLMDSGIPLGVAGATHALTSPQASWPAVDLAPASASHAQTVDSVPIWQAQDLLIDSAAHVQYAAQSQHPVPNLAVDSATHAHTAAVCDLNQAHVLIAASSSHDLTSTSPTLVEVPAGDLNIASSAHAQSAGNLDLFFATQLVINNASHAQTAQNRTLTQVHNLTTQSASHAQTTTVVLLGFGIYIDSSSHGVGSSTPLLIWVIGPAAGGGGALTDPWAEEAGIPHPGGQGAGPDWIGGAGGSLDPAEADALPITFPYVGVS